MLTEMGQLRIGGRRSAVVGELAGFPLVAHLSHDMADTSVTLELQGVPRHVSYGRDDLRQAPPLGLLSRVANLVSDLESRAQQADRAAGEATREAARAADRVGLVFEHTGRLASLRQRLADVDAQLAPPEPSTPGSPATATPAQPGSLAALVDASFPAGKTAGPPVAVDRSSGAPRPEVAPARQVER